jgi:hypothetical protein
MQVVESAELGRVASRAPKHANRRARLGLAEVTVVPPLAVAEAILQGDCCTTASAPDAPVLRCRVLHRWALPAAQVWR